MTNPTIKYDTSKFDAALQAISFGVNDLKTIESKGALVLKEGMQQRAAKDTGDMSDGIQSHIIEESNEKIEDDVGPEASYAPYQEYGTGIYAEAGNGRKTPWVYRDRNGNFHTTRGNRPHPFVRPTALQDHDKVIEAMDKEFKRKLLTAWLR